MSVPVGVKNYTESPTLLQYQSKIELGEDNTYIPNKRRQIPEIENNPSIPDALNSIFLPKEWEENGKKFIQYVSQEPGTREKGICPVREELYSQCFDEIIRQVTIECPERGLLLLKVRDEIKNTISSYRTLYESAILFGIRKQLEAEVGKDAIKKEISELEKKKVELISQKIELDNQIKQFEKESEERNKMENSKREEESAFLRQQNENLDKYLKSIDQSKG